MGSSSRFHDIVSLSRAFPRSALAGGSRRPPPPSRRRRRAGRGFAPPVRDRRPSALSTTSTPAGAATARFAASSVTSAPRRRASAASATPMRPEERLPRKRTASSGSRVPPAADEDVRAARASLRPAEQLLDPASDGLRARVIRPAPTSPSAELARVRADELDSARTQRGRVRLSRLVLPHARCSSPARPAPGPGARAPPR